MACLPAGDGVKRLSKTWSKREVYNREVHRCCSSTARERYDVQERHHCTQEAQERCKVDTVPERREVCLSAKSWPAGQGWGGKEEGTGIGDFRTMTDG